MRRAASIASILIGLLLIIGGVGTWIVVSNTLSEQQITDEHALEATGGLRYAELDREDPLRQTAATASFLQASLFTSVVAFGVAAMAALIGLLFILIGLGIRDVARQTAATR
jgi:hypothetical protein